MAMSGLTLSGGTSRTVEIYDVKTAAGWSAPTSVPFTPPLYPRVFVLPNGNVFYTGQGSGTNTANAYLFNPSTKTWTASATSTRNRTYGSSVLLPLVPPAYVPRVMYFGGGNPGTATTDIIDLSAATPAWTPGPNMSAARIQMNAVILPNGKILAEGGSLNNESPDGQGKSADLYDPASNKMSSAGTAAYARLYHSTALLLPDATVVSMGSNPGGRGSYEPAMEIYTPPYLYDANDELITNKRPQITALSFSGPIGYNKPFQVSYNASSQIASAVLVRPGSSTHATDMDQRLISLCGGALACTASNDTLSLTTPPNGNIAPPGYYMLFLLDSSGVPSVAEFIQLTPHITVAPRGTIGSPAANVTIQAGGTVSFATATTGATYSWVFPGGSPATSSAQNPGKVAYSTPGTYTASLTVADSTGNSDPSPPTRTVTVLPATPDFNITVTPPDQQVVPGGLAKYSVTITPLTGFTGTVSLSVSSESGFPAGVTSSFSQPSIVGSGSSTLTMSTTTASIPYAVSLTITGTSGTISHTASTTLLINLAPPLGLTATPGVTKVSLSWPASIGATYYHAKRAAVAGGPYRTLACIADTSFVDTSVVNGNTYYYVVDAGYVGSPNAGGESADSVEANATPKSSFIVDASASARGTSSVTTPGIRTALPGELLLAFVGSDGPSTGAQTAAVTGAGLTWTLVKRANSQFGTAEVWAATAATALSNATVTAKGAKTGYDLSLYVIAVQGTAGIGNSAAASAQSGPPSVTLQTTKAGSLIYGVGNDWSNAVARTPGANQILDNQWLDTRTGDTYWVQNETFPPFISAGASVTLNDTAPTTDRWNFVAVEILGK
jgi:PKD repeat protein